MKDNEYRFWDEDAKEMITWNQALHMQEKGETTIKELLTQQPFIPMQYTGVKDVDSKKIYENDIVRDCQFKPNGLRNGSRFSKIVRFYRGSRFVGFNIGDTGNLRVVGNVYQHPHLITSKTK